MLTLLNPEMIDFLPENVTSLNTSRQHLEMCILNYVKSSIILPWGDFLITIYVLYSILLFVGVLGNCWLISVTVRLLKLPTTSNNGGVVKRFYIYSTTLSIANLLVVLTIPFMVYSITIQRWTFGQGVCKFYYIIESFNKFVSIYILVVLSYERYTSICRRLILIKQSAYSTLSVLISTVLLLLIPIYIHAGQYSYDYSVNIDNVTFTVNIAECSLRLEHNLMTLFVWYTFLLGFCMPTCLIAYFYLRIIFYIYSHSRTLSTLKSHVPFKRVTILTLFIILFYCFSWGPYWCRMLYDDNNLESLAGKQQEQNETNWYIYIVIHTLVYSNAALNWILYAFLNTNLRQNRYSEQSQQSSITANWHQRRLTLYSRTATMSTSFSSRRTTRLSSSARPLEFKQLEYYYPGERAL